MPLDARKAQHLLQAITSSFAGRQRTIVLVYLVNGSYTYSLTRGIMRPLRAVDPQVPHAQTPAQSLLPSTADTLLIAPAGTNFTGVVYVADTTTATQSAVANATTYEIVEVLPIGMLEGGSRLRVSLRRLR